MADKTFYKDEQGREVCDIRGRVPITRDQFSHLQAIAKAEEKTWRELVNEGLSAHLQAIFKRSVPKTEAEPAPAPKEKPPAKKGAVKAKKAQGRGQQKTPRPAPKANASHHPPSSSALKRLKQSSPWKRSNGATSRQAASAR